MSGPICDHLTGDGVSYNSSATNSRSYRYSHLNNLRVPLMGRDFSRNPLRIYTLPITGFVSDTLRQNQCKPFIPKISGGRGGTPVNSWAISALGTGFALDAVNSLFGDDGNHDQAGHGIGPPKAEYGIQQQSAEQDGRQIRAEVGLLGVSVHGGAAEGTSHFSLGAGKQGHSEQRGAGERDSCDAALRCVTLHEIANRFVGDVGGERQEANANDSQRKPFVAFAAMDVFVDTHAPQQCRTRGDFDQAVDAETDERDAPRDRSRNDSDETFDAIPREREVLQSAASTECNCSIALRRKHHADILSHTVVRALRRSLTLRYTSPFAPQHLYRSEGAPHVIPGHFLRSRKPATLP